MPNNNLKNEIWKDIKGYENLYQISNYGRVKSLERLIQHKNGKLVKRKSKILKQISDKDGYLRVGLWKNNIRKMYRVHRLVAKAFIPNPENKPYIDHIDTNIKNNCLTNLRWVTQKENLTQNEITKERIRKSSAETVKKNQKKAAEANKKKVLCITTGKVFNSTVEANNYYNIKNKYAICNASNPKCGTKYAGFIIDDNGKKIKLQWKYLD